MAASKKALQGVEESLDALRQLIAKVAASVYATEDLFEKLIWDDRTDERDEERRFEHLSHLIDTTRETVNAAVEMGEEISTDLFKLRTAARSAAMSPRALRLADVLCGQLAALGPGACSLSVVPCSTWQLIRIGAASHAVLRHLAEDLGLDQARTGSRVWWRQMVPTPSGAVVVSVGLHRALPALDEGKP